MATDPPTSKPSPVLRNTLILVGAQVVGIPLSILVNAFMGRYLGASDFGHVYLAGALTGFGFLFVDWGQTGVLPAAVAQDRSRAGVLLGTALGWRLGSSVIVTLLLILGAWLFGYSTRLQVILAIVAVQCIFATLSGACQDVVRGHERTDVAALARIGFLLLSAALVVPALLLGGDIHVVMIAQVVAQLLVAIPVWRVARRVVSTQVSFDRAEAKQLVHSGSSFLIFALALTAQSNTDAILLSKLTSPEVVGWHAAAQRLIGTLVVPANALSSALYPTLARLYVEDKEDYLATAKRALCGTAVLAVPLALCCAIYRDLGIALYSKEHFAPASQNLLVLSAVLFLYYFSMPLGSALVAAGRQRAWAIAQASCVLVSLTLGPLLIPWFQRRYGNGGLGVCVGAVVSESLMVGAALFIAPRGVVDRSVGKALAKGFFAGAVMVGAAYLLRGIPSLIAGVIAVLVYGATLWMIGGVDREQVEGFKSALRRKIARKA
jgi:O-antigen/teichoic acid export membrane protein